jgi:hypothetical protein
MLESYAKLTTNTVRSIKEQREESREQRAEGVEQRAESRGHIPLHRAGVETTIPACKTRTLRLILALPFFITVTLTSLKLR